MASSQKSFDVTDNFFSREIYFSYFIQVVVTVVVAMVIML
jgi:hypothetical protein